MKLDLDQGWRDATQMIGKNAGLLAIIAGVFFFLPSAVLMVAFPELSQMGQSGNPQDLEAMLAPLMAIYKQYWWAFLISGLIQTAGMLAVVALLQQRPQLTVGQALQAGLKGLPIYIAGQLLLVLTFFLFGMLIGFIGGVSGSPAVATLLLICMFVTLVYAYTKTSLVIPVIVVDKKSNPIVALQRSWQITKGNSLRLFGFYLLVAIVAFIAMMVISMILGLIFALGGEGVALFGNAIVSSLINAVMFVLFSAIMAAAHRQLSDNGKTASDATPNISGR